MSRASLLALAVTLVIGAVALVSSGRGALVGGPGGPGPVVTETFSAPLGDVERLDAEVRQGAGSLDLRTVDGANAYEASLVHNQGLRVSVSYDDGDLRISDEADRVRWGDVTNEWTVALNRRVPVDLTVASGAGRATLDLTGITGSATVNSGAGEVRVRFGEGSGVVERLEFRSGAGRLEAVGLGNAHASAVEARAGAGEVLLDFTGAARGTTQVEIRGGVGRITLIVPDGLGARIRVSGGFASRVSVTGFRQVGGNEYVNDAWSGAGPKIDVRAALGVGRFEVRGR